MSTIVEYWGRCVSYASAVLFVYHLSDVHNFERDLVSFSPKKIFCKCISFCREPSSHFEDFDDCDAIIDYSVSNPITMYIFVKRLC